MTIADGRGKARETRCARAGEAFWPCDVSRRVCTIDALKRFLTELEARLVALPPTERAELAGAVKTLVTAVTKSTGTIGQRFKPSKVATLGVLTDLMGALSDGAALLKRLKQIAPTIGPHVTALVQAL